MMTLVKYIFEVLKKCTFGLQIMHHLYKVLGVCVEIITLSQVQCVVEKRYKMSILIQRIIT